jgi:hypothetical protein
MNKGKAPLDPNTLLGQLRVFVGDVQSSPLEPAEEGWGSYAVFGDESLLGALAAAGDNLNRAAGNLFATLAVEYMQLGKSVRTDDLAIDTRGRGKDLLEVARSFWEQAALSDAATGGDIFTVVGPAGRAAPVVRPEATPWPIL